MFMLKNFSTLNWWNEHYMPQQPIGNMKIYQNELDTLL